MKLSLVIPCYNEAENLPLLLKRCAEFGKYDSEIILVDNGSSDDTQKILNEIILNYSFCKSIRLEENLGYGNGIIQGLKMAKGDYIGWTHADLQTDPRDALKVIEILKDFDDKVLIKGRRYGRPFFDTFFTICMSIFETLLLKKIMWDINAQPTIFHRRFFSEWLNPPLDFSLDLYAYFHAKNKGYKILRFPVFFGPRIFGESKWNFGLQSRFKFIKRTVDYSLKLRKDLIS